MWLRVNKGQREVCLLLEFVSTQSVHLTPLEHLNPSSPQLLLPRPPTAVVVVLLDDAAAVDLPETANSGFR